MAWRSWPSRSLVCTSPPGQPVVAMIPLAYSASSSRSIRGLRKYPSSEDRDASRNRLCMPSVVSANSVMCVYAPAPDTSSSFCPGVPQRTGCLWLRCSGATYASMPMIGLMPAARALV